MYSPNTGIVDYDNVAAAYCDDMRENGGDLFLNSGVVGIARRNGRLHVETAGSGLSTKYVINCAGLHADRVARMMGAAINVRIVPFRGEYFSLRPERSHLVNGLIYPVPNPKLPFLGVHFSRRITGTVEAGPNAVLAYSREGYRKSDFSPRDMWDTLTYPGFWRMSRAHWSTGIREQYRSLVKRVFLRSLQTLVPEIVMDDLSDQGSGVRAQAVARDGGLVQDFSIAQSWSAIHVLNAPSPGATASLAIGQHIARLARKSFGLAA